MEPSWTFMDTYVDLTRLIFGDPCQKKGPQGPFKVQIGPNFKIDLWTTYKLKFTAWFVVNQTIASRETIVLICCGPFTLHPPP